MHAWITEGGPKALRGLGLNVNEADAQQLLRDRHKDSTRLNKDAKLYTRHKIVHKEHERSSLMSVPKGPLSHYPVLQV